MASVVLSKIEKILRLSKSDNVHEAANALAKARALAEKYNIGLELLGSETYKETDIIFYSRENDQPWLVASETWQMALAKVVSDHNHCRSFIMRGERSQALDIIGVSRDIEIATSMFFWLQTQLRSLIVQHVRGGVEADAFLLGAIHTVDQRLKESTQQARQEVMNAMSKRDRVQFAIETIDNRTSKIDNILKSMILKENRVSKNIQEYSWNLGQKSAQSLIINPGREIEQ